MNRLSTEKRATMVGLLVEGNSIRATRAFIRMDVLCNRRRLPGELDTSTTVDMTADII